jgi:hypothetical protein
MKSQRSMRASAITGRRTYSRLRLRLPARLVLLDRTVSAILCDLSVGGAQVQLPDPAGVGRQAILAWSNFEAFGTIGWVEGNRCGITFEEPVAPPVLIATRDLNDAQALPDELEMTREAAHGWANGTYRL